MLILLGVAAYILFFALFIGILFLLIKHAVKAGIREYFEEKEAIDDY